MKLLISAQQPELEGLIDRRFGRSPWFILFDTDSDSWEAFKNPGVEKSGGAGVAAAQFAVDKGVNVVISGDFGPHASNAFHVAQIEMRLFTQDVLHVNQAVELFKQDKLPEFI